MKEPVEASNVADAPRNPRGRRYGPGVQQALKIHQWTPEQTALLGTMSDAQVAEQIGGISFSIVQKKRRELGIPPVAPAYLPWPPEHIALLGVLPDSELAQLTGRSTKAVNQKRNRLGIPPARGSA